MITIYDIARKTGFSPTTVSKVFNGYTDVSQKTRRIILDTAAELGYVPNANARSLTTKRSWTIGMLFIEPAGSGIRHPYFGGVIDGFKKVATSKGYDLMFISKDIGGRKSGYLEHCKIRGVDGIIVILPDNADPYFHELMDSSIPMVMLDQYSATHSTISSDNIQGGVMAVEYLYSLGHRRIAHISGGLDTFAGEKRHEGYKMALNKLGIPLNPEYVAEGPADYSVESGYWAMRKVLGLEELPTAVFAAGDNLAVGAIQAIREQGLRVPEDISIIGFDDIEMAQFLTPALTTIRQDTYLLGSRAADMLISTIEGAHTVQDEILSTELIVRDSCQRQA
ncbi:LacI family DNA-binding transcriptional regulator [Paenibacillus sp. YPG26]|uniref:LacI family DNA-binding transcriptional regulator n=1 Tax=Paenibacillus sp. YPG26 TaxID=2878915 RepID=UPI00203CA34A|nr:LacI family DNA-binding transcriptional regulator [Paenibacillus sp. YPG26]USB34004.1 LacI family transcriptional regulator [Paenibacillus sp. YPG26]